jgi:release factor glutamine methyltransferase
VSADGTVRWRDLWREAADAAGGQPQGRWVCEVAGGFDAAELRASLDAPATERAVAHLDSMLERLRRGEPLQYVLGRWAFRRLDVLVDRRVLIPRPETEVLVDVALRLAGELSTPLRCADLGCGSGVIGLSLAVELPLVEEVWLTDASADALDVARANAAGIGTPAAAVRFGHGSWFEALPAAMNGRLHLVCANPPYVAAADELDAAVAEWEPAAALRSGADGLDDLRVIVREAPAWLMAGGWVVLEIGSSQGSAVHSLLKEAGFDGVAIHPDLAGRDRIAVGRTPG